jgi:phage FluMu gp28-like protein
MKEEREDIITSVYEDDGRSPSMVVQRDPEQDEMADLMEFMGTEIGLMTCVLDPGTLDSFSPTGTWEWEEYQLKYFECNTWYSSNKPRQGGISTAFAGKAFARGMLCKNNYNAIFTSYKKEEAVNKINYVRQFLEALPPRFRKKIIRSPSQLIEWENHNGTRAKIMSHAQRPIRGINGDIFLDELAFYQIADEIYTSALPAVVAVRGTIDVTSTPFGKGGKFYEIMSNVDKYPRFERHYIYWWECRRYLRQTDDDFLVKAIVQAPKLSVEERVYSFGNTWLIDQYKNADDEASFKQEFEAYFVDEQAAFFTREMILKCMFPSEDSRIDDYNPVETDFDMPIEEALDEGDNGRYAILEKYNGRKTKDGKPVDFRKYNSLDELYAAIRGGRVSNNLFGGADVGASGHSSHFVILEELELGDGQTLQVERFSLNRRGWDLTEQQNYYDSILSRGVLRKLRIDKNGIGFQMTSYLEGKYGTLVEGIIMGGNNKSQEEHMVNLRSRLENFGLALSYDRQTIEDLYSIKRVIGESRNISYKATEKRRHHADAAWAIAFASLCATPFGKSPLHFNTSSSSSVKVERLSQVMGLDGGISLQRRIGDSRFGVTPVEKAVFKNLSDPGRFLKNHDK